MIKNKIFTLLISGFILGLVFTGCSNQQEAGGTDEAAKRVYVAPGQYDEFYTFMSGGFSGQVTVYGIPSGRLFKIIPVFSQDAETAYGYSEETKAMLNTSYGIISNSDIHECSCRLC